MEKQIFSDIENYIDTHLKSVKMFNYFNGNISDKVMVKSFGKLCKTLNENTIDNDNTQGMIDQLVDLIASSSIVFNQIYTVFQPIRLLNKSNFILFKERVIAERRRQDMIWGPNQCHGYFWITVLGEELGEFYEELDFIDNHEPLKSKVEPAIKELIQFSAVAVAWWEELCESQNRKINNASHKRS